MLPMQNRSEKINELQNSGQFSYQTTSLTKAHASMCHSFPHELEGQLNIPIYVKTKETSIQVTCLSVEVF